MSLQKISYQPKNVGEVLYSKFYLIFQVQFKYLSRNLNYNFQEFPWSFLEFLIFFSKVLLILKI